MDAVINFLCFCNDVDKDFLNKALLVLYQRYPLLNSVIEFRDRWHWYINKPFLEKQSGCSC